MFHYYFEYVILVSQLIVDAQYDNQRHNTLACYASLAKSDDSVDYFQFGRIFFSSKF